MPEPSTARPHLLTRLATALLLVWALVAGLSACVSDGPVPATDTSLVSCDTSVVRFSVEITDVLRRNCYECHASNIATAGVILDTYTGVRTRVQTGQLISAVRQDGTVRPMPFLRARIPLCDLNKIEKWVREGALNN